MVAAWVRLRFLEGPMRYDEAFTVWRYAKNPLAEIVADYSLPNNHVFHTVLVHLAARVGGIHPDIVRLPALGAGVLMVPLGFLATGRIAGLTAGLVAAAFLTGSPLLIDYSVNARGYTMAAALSLLMMGMVAELRNGTLRRWSIPVLVLAGIAGGIGFWTVPVFAYLWAPLLLWLVAPGRYGTKRRRVLEMVGLGGVSLGVAFLLYLPVILSLGLDALTGNRFVAPDTFGVFGRELPTFLADVAKLWSRNVPVVLIPLLALGFLTALVDRKAPNVRWLAWSFVVGALAVHLAVRVNPAPRVWVLVLPFALTLASAGIGGLLDRTTQERQLRPVIAWLWGFALCVLLVWSVVRAEGPLSGEGGELLAAEAIALDLERSLTPGDFVAAVNPSTAPLRYYFELHGLPVAALRQPESLPSEVYVVTYGSQVPADVLDVVGVPLAAADAELISTYHTGSLWRVRLDAS